MLSSKARTRWTKSNAHPNVLSQCCNIDRESKQLRDARAALRRIREGTFGVCEECEEQIHPKRLVAISWASLCIQCQEAKDCNREEMRMTADNLLSNAA